MKKDAYVKKDEKCIIYYLKNQLKIFYKFASIFVAMSRVKNMDHIRLLTHQKEGVEFNPQEAYSYITELKPSNNVMAFYHGYQERDDTKEGICWNPSLALSYTNN